MSLPPPPFPTERDVRRGLELLVADRRAGDQPALSVGDALLEAYDLLSPDELNDVYDDPADVHRVRAALVRLNVEPTRAELARLVTLVVRATLGVVDASPLEAFWLAKARRGTLW